MPKRRGDDPKKDIESILQAVAKNANGIRTATFNTVKGKLVRRIFNEGRATNGGQIGTYRPSVREFRNKVGRQTNKVDLELTGTLRRAVVVGTEKNKVVLGIAEQNEPKISSKGGRLRVVGTSDFSTVENSIAQEDHFNKEIFAPSKDELKRGEKTVIKEVNIVAKKSLK